MSSSFASNDANESRNESILDTSTLEMELGKKLINKGLKKTEIAHQLAQKISSDSSILIDENDPSIKYLINAIKYGTNA